jgi:hypothetical protein
MAAILAAVVFGLALLLDLFDVRSDAFSNATLVTLGLFLLALHFCGVGSGWRHDRT